MANAIFVINCACGDNFWSYCGGMTKPNLSLYRVFCKSLLEGAICPKLEEFQEQLVVKVGAITHSISQPRVIKIVNALMERQVMSRKKLHLVWQKEPRFLLAEYLMWVPKRLQARVTGMWPPVAN